MDHKRYFAQQADPEWRLIREVWYEVRRASMRHPENHELDTLVTNLEKKMQNRSTRNAKEMGVNIRKQPVPTGKLQAPSLFARVFGGKRSELPWARRR